MDLIARDMAEKAFVTTNVPATNLVENGDFSDGTSGWYGGSNTSVGGILTNTNVEGSLKFLPGIYRQNIFPSPNTLYTRAVARVTNDVCRSLSLEDNTSPYVRIDNPVKDEWYTISGIKQSPSTQYCMLRHRYNNDITESVSMEVSHFLTIDLTATFGAGNEPTVDQMDVLLTQFPNSWFDGTRNLFNAEHFMSMYFNKITELENAITALGGGS